MAPHRPTNTPAPNAAPRPATARTGGAPDRTADASDRTGGTHPHWHTLTVEQTLSELGTSPQGLSNQRALSLLAQHGPNELTEHQVRSLAHMIRDQLTEPMVLILVGAAALSAVLQEWAEAVIIFIIVVVNTLIGVVQERKAQSSLEALRTMSAPTAHIVRDGAEVVVPASTLVPGDVVLLADGSMVPADLRLTETANLRIQEASLTGESLPSEKHAESLLAPGAALGDRANMAYATSIVTAGRGKGVVVATGMNTEVGRIAGLLSGEDANDTPLKRKLAAFGKTLTIVGVAAAFAVLAVGMLYGREFAPMLLVAVSLAISVIPESLPATATIVMALGVQRMAKHQALIRRLPAVETLGGVTVICTDKTGTLTENRMSVVQVGLPRSPEAYPTRLADDTLAPSTMPAASALEALDPAAAYARHPRQMGALAFVAALCNDASFNENAAPSQENATLGDPTEGALIVMARSIGQNVAALRRSHPRLAERPFDSERKRMSTVHEHEGRIVVAVKGSLDGILPLCTSVMDENGVRPLEERDRTLLENLAESLSHQALRVLACATGTLPALPDGSEDVERNLTFLGLVGMMDPPRPEVRAAVETCRSAGIRTIMITGDHAATARAIAEQLSIYQPGDLVVSGDQMEEMDDDQLDAAIERTSVFARVSPTHKLRIVRALKHNREVVSMTGDGVNDAPALKSADIGVAMGITGTDVAKDAADMILLDDRFTTIEYAVKEGRRVFRNIQKVVQFLVADNVAEIALLLAAVLLNWGTPLSPVMILWINLATATLPALALGVEPPSRHIMEHPPLRSSSLLGEGLARRVVVQGLFVGVLALVAFRWGTSQGGEALGQTMTFGVLAFSQVLRALNQRSTTDPVWNREGGTNWWLGGAVAVSLALVLAVLAVEPLRAFFGTVGMTPAQWGLVVGLALMSLVQIELAKLAVRLRASRTQALRNHRRASRIAGKRTESRR